MKFTLSASILLSFILSPLSSFAISNSSTVFEPSSCPIETNLSTHLISEINSRVDGVTASDTTKKIFTSSNFTTQTYARNPNVWTNRISPIDLTGLSPWNTTGANTRAGTLISPRHVAFANHYQISDGATLVFVGSDNSVATRTLIAKTSVAGTDITIGVLNEDVPVGITHYPIISKTNFDNYLSTVQVPMLVLDQEEKALVNDITFISNSVHHSTPSGSSPRFPFNEVLIGGDSGNPGFVIIDGKPVLVLTHLGSGLGPNYGSYLSEINSIMNSLGGGYDTSSYNLSCFNKRPSIANPLANFSVEEGSSLNTVVGTVTASDDNVGDTLSYSITSGNTNNVFSINSSGSILVASSTGINFQLKSVYALGVSIADDASTPLTTSTSVIINVTNVLDVPTITSFNFSVDENISTETLIGTLSYFSDATSTPSFQKLSGSSAFSIDVDTGGIYLEAGNSLDFETQNSYTIVSEISDENGTSTAEILISVNDKNESPSITSTSFSVVDSASVGTNVGTIEVVDVDVGDSFISSILSGNVQNAFSIDIFTGHITVNNSSAIDRSVRTSITLLVRVQDTRVPYLSDTQSVLVTITPKPSGGGGGGGGGRGSSSSVTTQKTTPPNTVSNTSPLVPRPTPNIFSYYAYTRNLTVGDSGEDVKQLQTILNSQGFTVATTGAGSPGNETSMFGGLTRAALARFQVAKGIVPAVGYFGPVTRGSIGSAR